MTRLPPGSLWTPSKAKNGRKVIVTLHGHGGKATDFEGLEKELDLPEANYLSLSGPHPFYNGHTWYTSPNLMSDALSRVSCAMDFLGKKGFDPHAQFILGFSQGAAVALEYAVRGPHPLGGHIAINGRIEDLPRFLREIHPSIQKNGRFLLTHGNKDTQMSPSITRLQAEQLLARGFSIQYREFDKGHTFDFEHELPFIRQWIERSS